MTAAPTVDPKPPATLRLVRAVVPSPLRALARPLRRRLATSAINPAHWARAWRLTRILAVQYGYVRSVAAGRPMDADGAPCPWYTYPALEYLRQLDFSGKTVFEYGSGHSTLFWCARAARVVSVEHDRGWYELIRPQLPAESCELLQESDSDAYAATIDRVGGVFDVIVVDGLVTGRTRLKCARAAVRHLRDGGMIILDNSDWLPESSRFLRESGLIEVDMTGFAPINTYTCTTSFYLHPAFSFRPLADRQPQPGTGAQPFNWERQAMQERLALAPRPDGPTDTHAWERGVL
jgi:hypothetical protein